MRQKPVEIRLLGELEILHGGQRQTLPASKKTRALLGYLVATERSQLRERLCELFWEVPDDPRASLRWSLTKIRPLVDDGAVTRLVADRERAGFEAHGAAIDLAEVRALPSLAEAPTDLLRRAAGLFRGELLEGLDLPDCYRYHEWCIGEREAIRALRVAIVQTLVTRLESEPEEALRHARAWVAIDPLVEDAHVAVVRLLGKLKRPQEALKQYEACRRMIESELRAKPSANLERARMALGQPAAVVPEPAIAPPSPTVKSSALVGRDDERALIERQIAEAGAGRAQQVVAFVGEPGIGKSRLLAEVDSRVRAAGGQVLAGRAFEAETVRPYGAWIDALRTVRLDGLDEGLRADLAAFLPELGSSRETGDRHRLFDAVVEVLRGLSSTAPVALLLDDVHWLDNASAALLHYVVRAVYASGSSIVIALGARPGELADNPVARQLVRALDRDGKLRLIELCPLDPGHVAALVHAIDATLDGKRVFEESAGNPLFALEVARALQQSGDARSNSLDGLIDDRLTGLEGRARELLPWAAALGRGFDLDTLTRILSLAPSELLAAIEALERHGILRTVGSDGSYDFAHDLLRRASYRQMSQPRRRLVHRQIAHELATHADPDGTLAADLAHHAALGGDHELAARACVSAGERCLRLFAFGEAIELVERGRAHLPHLPHDARVHLHIQLLKIKVLAGSTGGAVPGGSYLARNAPELEAEIAGAISEAQAAGRLEDASSGFLALAALAHDIGDARTCEAAALHAAEAVRAAEPATTAKQLAATARCLVQIEGDMAQARSLIGEAQTLAEQLGIDIAELYWGLGLLGHWDGNYDASRQFLERGLAAARRAQDRWRESGCLVWLAIIALERLDTVEALARCAELSPVAAKMGEGSEVPFTEALEALSRLAADEPGAVEKVDRALAGLRDIDSKAHLAYALNFAATIDLRKGRVASARRRAEEALIAAEQVKRKSESTLARALLARVAVESGERARAAEVLAPVLEAGATGVHARAREAALKAAQLLGISIPTLATTPRS